MAKQLATIGKQLATIGKQLATIYLHITYKLLSLKKCTYGNLVHMYLFFIYCIF